MNSKCYYDRACTNPLVSQWPLFSCTLLAWGADWFIYHHFTAEWAANFSTITKLIMTSLGGGGAKSETKLSSRCLNTAFLSYLAVSHPLYQIVWVTISTTLISTFFAPQLHHSGKRSIGQSIVSGLHPDTGMWRQLSVFYNNIWDASPQWASFRREWAGGRLPDA